MDLVLFIFISFQLWNFLKQAQEDDFLQITQGLLMCLTYRSVIYKRETLVDLWKEVVKAQRRHQW